MNKRIVSMIQSLGSTKRTFYISDLAEKFQVSQRTVRNDLNAINDILKEHGLSALKLEKGGQVICPENFSEVLDFVDGKDFYEYKLSKEERKKIASVLLIGSPGFITLSEIAEHMAVSRATVIHDLEEIKAYIRQGNLEVRSHPNKGLRLEGKESDKRLFLLRLLSHGQDPANEDVVEKQIAVEEEIRAVLEKILYEQEHAHECFLSDSSFQKIRAYLRILVNRLSQGEYLEARKMQENSKYAMARDILKYTGQYCHLNITKDEIQFLSELLSFGRYMKEKDSNRDSVKIQMVTRQFIEGISEQLGTDLTRDYEFFEKLASHLESTLSMAADQERNPVIEKVAEENPETGQAVKKTVSIIRQYAGRELSDIELGYITVHVCAAVERKKNKEISFHVIVACHAGIGTSYLLLEKLKKHFNFQIIDIISSHEAGNLTQGQADFVISTVPLKKCGIEHITVSPLLEDEDYIRIGNMIDSLRSSRHLPSRGKERKRTAKELLGKIAPVLYDRVPEEAEDLMERLGKIVADYFKETPDMGEDMYSPMLYQLLPASHIQLGIECADWREAVRASSVRLLELGYIEERYIDAMIRNIEENGPYIVLSKGFALPHEGVGQGTKKLGMNLIRLSKPVEFDAEERDPVEFVCCLSAVDHKTHLKAFFHLVNLLKREEFKEALRRSRSPEEMAEAVRRFEMDAD